LIQPSGRKAGRLPAVSEPQLGLYELGFTNLVNLADGDDLDGKYFTNECYRVAFTGYDLYTVTVEAVLSQRADKPTSPAIVTLDQDGVWTP
jgi:hypothetical protein